MMPTSHAPTKSADDAGSLHERIKPVVRRIDARVLADILRRGYVLDPSV